MFCLCCNDVIKWKHFLSDPDDVLSVLLCMLLHCLGLGYEKMVHDVYFKVFISRWDYHYFMPCCICAQQDPVVWLDGYMILWSEYPVWPLLWHGGKLGGLSHAIYELMIEIFWKLYLLQLLFQWLNKVTIVHMPQQLSCCGMCKIVIWFNHHFTHKTKCNFCKIWIMSS